MSILYYYELPNNTSQSVLIPISFQEQPIASLTPYLGSNQAASLNAMIGWQATGRTSVTRVQFTIWRDAPFTGVSVCSFIDSCESVYDKFKVSNIAHVDTGFTPNQNTTYVLTAQLLNPDSAASIIGGLTFLTTVNQLG